jgi:serine/threonine-protein kinase
VAVRAITHTTRLGRYEIVERLAEGGMADVLLARTVGIEGFERHVVIKRIRAAQARDIRYVTMFLDEARLAASLHHANIVQVNDIGEEDGEYFFAMEYVHGEDVRRILERVSGDGGRVPLHHVLSTVMAAAAGLHHAHEQIRPDGACLGIVHRDVSPANILIGYDGGVKVVDFGIAKAVHQSGQTQSGVLKGKVAYMSPEQCNNEPIDRRSDVFSLGVVLWELLAVRPLFQRENDFLSMSAIVQSDVPPLSSVWPDIPVELEHITRKALARSPAERFASADELRHALEQFAEHAGVRTSTTALADYMKELFGQRREPWLRHTSPRPASEGDLLEIQIEGAGTAPAVSAPSQPALAPPALAPPARRGRRWLVPAAAIGTIAVALTVVGLRRPRDTASGDRREPASAAAPELKPAAPAASQVQAPPSTSQAPAGDGTAAGGAQVPVVDGTTAGGAQVEARHTPETDSGSPPAPKKHHHKVPKADPAKHWDPNALFPE